MSYKYQSRKLGIMLLLFSTILFGSVLLTTFYFLDVYRGYTINYYNNGLEDYDYTKLIYPEDINATNNLVIGGTNVNEWGDQKTIVPINTILKEYRITGIFIANISDDYELYQIEVIAFLGGNTRVIGYDNFVGVLGVQMININLLVEFAIPANYGIKIRTRTAGGGNDSFQAWIKYIQKE